MIMLVNSIHPFDPLTAGLLLKAEIIYRSTLRKRVRLHTYTVIFKSHDRMICI